ncbi:MAG: hypothetical protein HS129_15125 [Leptospiraceae bacterium]|nr:hypothetical protein [Leptospiraceae bacterium]NUM41337.1 hypothetical protein [Leptospiraceae bacterium]
MYNQSVINRAFNLFLLGNNPEQIEGILKSDFPKITANTIRNWAEKPDALGEVWEDKRKAVDNAARKRIIDQASTQRSKIFAKTDTLINAAYNQIVDESGKAIVEAKTLEGMLYAFKAISEFQLKLEKDEESGFSPMQSAEILLEVLNEIPSVRKAIKTAWPEIQRKLTARFDIISKPKQVEGKVVK